MAKVPLNPRVGAYGQQQGYYPPQQQGMTYEDLHEGPIDPREITKNGGVLFSFVNAIAKGVAETESNELAVRNYVGGLKDQNALYHSKIPSLEAVGNQMARLMNEGERQRAIAQQRANQQPAIQVNLTDLLNADKAFDNITQGSSRPVIQNNYTKEEPKTMSDIDISEYLGGTPQRSAVQQNNTFYVNMDKTTKALLAEQVKTNKLLGVLVQTVRENGVKIDELPQHITEVLTSNNLPDADLSEDISTDIDDTLLP
jgi:hypothetical protein